MSKKRTIKPLKELNLLDRFLFAQVMEDPKNMLMLLQIIFGRQMELAGLPQTEKELRTDTINRFVKLDVWAVDSEGGVYDTEVQQENTHNLPKRSRYYQSMVDRQLLASGEIDFNRMNPVYIVVIAPFDLFGQGKYQYTFRMRCDEKPDIALEDGAVWIFLNTRGTNAQDVSGELVELLRYMEHTDDAMAAACESDAIRKLHRRIEEIKASEEVGLKYMQAWEERIMEINQAKAEGKAEGKEDTLIALYAEGIIDFKTLVAQMNMPEEEVRRKLIQT